MPTVTANNVSINYVQQGSGEPLILIPYLAADHACYAFQVPEYAKHFTCVSLDLRGTGESGRSDGDYSTELFADDVAALMDKLNIERAHIAGLSLGAATGLWLGAKYPDKVMSLSVHAGWTKTDKYLETVIAGWQIAARALDNIPELTVQMIFPWCFTPELFDNAEYLGTLSGFVRSRPAQPVAEFLKHSNAVIAHDVESRLGDIKAPTLITVGSHDMLTSTRFTDVMKAKIASSEVHVFEGCAHAPLYQDVERFNAKTLEFLQEQS